MSVAPTPSEKAQGDTVLTPQNPWPSLSAFSQKNAAFFFGRTDEIDDLHRRIKRRLLTVLFGVSGLGKTSLIQAGLLPRFDDATFFPVLIRLDHHPGAEDLIAQVRRSIAEAIKGPAERGELNVLRPPLPDEDLWCYFHDRELDWHTADGDPINVVLIFDQFEEIFTRESHSRAMEERARRFLTTLACLAENSPPRELEAKIECDPDLIAKYDFRQEDYRVLISLREDFIPHLEAYKKLIPSLMENRMRLSRMREEQALEAVLGPGHEIVDEATAGEIVRFVAGRGRVAELVGEQAEEVKEVADEDVGEIEIDPALLSLICSELNLKRGAEPRISVTTAQLRQQGGDILNAYYERCFSSIESSRQRSAVRRFVEDRLLTPDGYHRDNVSLQAAQNELRLCGANPETIDRLVEQRLLQYDERKGTRVELTHDILTGVARESRLIRRRGERRWRALGRAAIGLAAVSFVVAVCMLWIAVRESKRAARTLGEPFQQKIHEAITTRRLLDARLLLTEGRTQAEMPAIAALEMAAERPRLRIGRRVSAHASIQQLSWAHDGTYVCALTEEGVLLLAERSAFFRGEFEEISGWETDDRVRTIRVQGDRNLKPATPALFFTAVLFNPGAADGAQLATIARDGRLRLIDLHARRVVQNVVFPFLDLSSSETLAKEGDAEERDQVKQDSWSRTRRASASTRSLPVYPTAMAFDRAGTRLAIGFSNGLGCQLTLNPTLRQWELPPPEKFFAILDAPEDEKGKPKISKNRFTLVSGPAATSESEPGSTSERISSRLEQISSSSEIRFVGHTDDVLWAHLSPDRKLVASGSSDGTSRIWDARTGEEQRHKLQAEHPVTSGAWSSDGTQLLVVTSDDDEESARLISSWIWDSKTKTWASTRPLSVPSGGGKITAVHFFDAAQHRATVTIGSSLMVWDVRDGSMAPASDKLLSVIRGGPVSSLVFDAGEGILLVRTLQRLSWLDAKDGSVQESLANSGGSLRRSIASHPASNRLALLTGTEGDGQSNEKDDVKSVEKSNEKLGGVAGWGLLEYDAYSDGTKAITVEQREVKEDAGYDASALAWHPAGDLLALGTTRGRILLFRNGTDLVESVAAHRKAVSSLHWSADGRHLLSGSADGEITTWTFETQVSLAFQLPVARSEPVVAALDDAGHLFASQGAEFCVWNLSDRQVTRPAVPSGFGDGPKDRVWWQDGRRALLQSSTGEMIVWDMVARKTVTHWRPAKTEPLARALMSGSGQRAVLIHADGVATLWQTAEARILQEIPASGQGTLAAFSADRLVLASSDGIVREHDGVRSREVGRWKNEGKSPSVLACSEKGLVAVGGDETSVYLLDLRDEQKRTEITSTASALCFSEDGDVLFLGGTGGSIAAWYIPAVWDVEGEAPFITFRHHTERVTWLALNQAGLVSVDTSGSVRVWQRLEAEGASANLLRSASGLALRGLTLVPMTLPDHRAMLERVPIAAVDPNLRDLLKASAATTYELARTAEAEEPAGTPMPLKQLTSPISAVVERPGFPNDLRKRFAESWPILSPGDQETKFSRICRLLRATRMVGPAVALELLKPLVDSVKSEPGWLQRALHERMADVLAELWLKLPAETREAGGGDGGVYEQEILAHLRDARRFDPNPEPKVSSELSRVANAIYGRGSDNYNADRKKEGRKLVEQSIEIDPQNGFFLRNLALIVRRAGEFDLAQKYCSTALRVAGHDKDEKALALESFALTANARAEIEEDRQKKAALRAEARSYLDQAVAIAPESPEAHTSLGVHLEKEKAYLDAIAEYTRALKLRPGHVLARRHRGVCYRERYQLDDALADFDGIAKDESPNNGDRAFSLAEIGEIQRLRGYPSLAVEALTRSLELDKKDYWTLAQRARAYEALGRLEEARRDLDAAVTDEEAAAIEDGRPKPSEYRLRRGIFLLRQGSLTEARSDWAALPDSRMALIWLAKTSLSKDLDAARQLLQEVAKRSALTVDDFECRAIAYAYLGDFPAAEAAVMEARKNSQNPGWTAVVSARVFAIQALRSADAESRDRAKRRVLVQLAEAVRHFFGDRQELEQIDDFDILKEDITFQSLRDALRIPFDKPARYLELARFYCAIATLLDHDSGDALPEDALTAAENALAQADRFGGPNADVVRRDVRLGRLKVDGRLDRALERIPMRKIANLAREELAELKRVLARLEERSEVEEGEVVAWSQIEPAVQSERLKRSGGRDPLGRAYTLRAGSPPSLAAESFVALNSALDDPDTFWTGEAD
jgi:WD40 repeat protein/tetratricopeptide (TPR) repeat protein